MRGIKIDVYAQSVYDVDHPNNYRDIYDQLSDPIHKVGSFTSIGLGKDVLYVDEVGLLEAERRPDDIRFFRWRGYYQPIAGNGIILGVDPWGNSCSTVLKTDYVREQVTFPDVKMTGWTEMGGHGNVIIMPQPIFEPRIDREPGHG